MTAPHRDVLDESVLLFWLAVGFAVPWWVGIVTLLRWAFG